MSDVFYEFEEVDTFTTGAVGRPGERMFFLQARNGRTRVAVKCEKQQVAAISQYLRRVLNDLPPAEERPLPAALQLVEPVDVVFVLGPIGLGYDRATDRLVVQLEEVGEVDEEGDGGRGPRRSRAALRHPRPGRRVLRPRRRGDRCRAARLPVVRAPDRPRRTRMPAHELTPLATEAIPDPIAFMMHAEPEVEGRMPWSSNATFLVTMRCGDATQQAIYKPVRGERPLWDFEPGLHRRERAAYLLSEHLAIDAVPPTVMRDGPYGEGSFQWFVDADHRQHYFTIHEQHESLHDAAAGDRRLRRARQQHRPQVWALPARRATACGRSTTACASARRTSCGR